MTSRSIVAGGLLVLALHLGGVPAAAHTITEGTSGFTDGLLHPVTVPAHLLVLVAAGLLLAQRDATTLKPAIYGLATGMGGGLVLAALGFTSTLAIPALLSLAAIMGLFAALARPLPDAMLVPLAALATFGIAADSAPESPSIWATAAALSGTGIALLLLILNLVALGHYLDRPWQKVGIRVLGSWISASALMVLALLIHTQAS